MSKGSYTYPDHILSIFQSAAAQISRDENDADKSGDTEARSPGQSGLLQAATDIAGLRMEGRVDEKARGPADNEVQLEGLSPAGLARVCASLGLQYLEAKLKGDQSTADRLRNELNDSKCDVRWASTIDQYLRYFGPSGTRAEIPYVTPAEAGETVITIPDDATIGLIGDWGTGGIPARRLLQQLKDKKPDIIVHLGDIYFSGTPQECETNFEEILDDVFDREKTGIPVYTLAGNHDLYSGGVGYYGLIERLNPKPFTQPASFFCLRTKNAKWQFLAMDTGLHDYNPFTVNDAVTFVEAEEEKWHRRRIEEFAGSTILMSHHQLFSAFSEIGKADDRARRAAYNPKLRQTFEMLQSIGKPIPAWFWGHEHNLCLYEPYIGLAKGRCVGCSAIPTFVDDDPYDVIEGLKEPPALINGTKLSVSGNVFTNAFATLSITKEGPIEARYFEDLNGNCIQKYSETISGG
ncbi:metallophosphoesterase [Bradyrhizobium sp. S3.5.5]|uniref:metallophosphoesterase family protein n=1 Tax=Bradyrhizobium sp. S3.5.5 TaxID=3156430 RepID=UPI00339B5715